MTLDSEGKGHYWSEQLLTESYTDILVTALCKKFRTFGISINLNMLGEIAQKWQV